MLPGDTLELTVGEAVHGGWCVARPDGGGPVVFVRHALPGERVRAVITQATARLSRADAVQILQASADRVAAPCPHARPGGCGGCDWQHASLPAQRRLKAAVIRQQLARIAGLDREVSVEALPGDEPEAAGAGLGWRTRVSFAVAPDGTAGLRRHRSHEVVAIGECPIAHPAVNAAGVTGQRWPGVQSVQVEAVPATGERGVLVTGGRPGELPAVAADSVRQVRRPERRGRRSSAATGLAGRSYLTQRAAGRDWRVALGGFWQVHLAAAETLAAAVLAALQPQPGDVALDLYCGAGLFAGVLAPRVGPAGRVIAVESDDAAVRDARHNLREFGWARVHRGDAGEMAGRLDLSEVTLVVADPPRAGLAQPVIDALGGGRGAAPRAAGGPRRIAYVSCDPATLARDLGQLVAGGWQLDDLRAFDAFPMTHHVECLATLSAGPGRQRGLAG
ncbi:MAG TPA: TRAM domain-containing protein [Streptosporangiaceae bacterium]|nr:TRAM domain-containing protein [Streptosporangiaceae bacterium]